MSRFTPSRMQVKASEFKARWGIHLIYLTLFLLTTAVTVAVGLYQY